MLNKLINLIKCKKKPPFILPFSFCCLDNMNHINHESPWFCGLSKTKLSSCFLNYLQPLSSIIAWNCHFLKLKALINLQYLFCPFYIREKKHGRGICIHHNLFNIHLMSLRRLRHYRTQGGGGDRHRPCLKDLCPQDIYLYLWDRTENKQWECNRTLPKNGIACHC